MQLTVSAEVLADGRLRGSVGATGQAGQPFEGWLEFLAVLTRLLARSAVVAEPAPPPALAP